MDTIARQKALADSILKELAHLDPLLAGGAPRDWYIEKEACDLDFYIQTDNPEESAELVSNTLEIDLRPLGDKAYDKLLKDDNPLQAVYEGEIGEQIVQFMFVSINPKEFVENFFDFSICQVWYENGEIGMNWKSRLSFREKLIVGNDGWGAHFEKIIERREWQDFRWCHNWDTALNALERDRHRRRVAAPEIVFMDDNDLAIIEDEF